MADPWCFVLLERFGIRGVSSACFMSIRTDKIRCLSVMMEGKKNCCGDGGQSYLVKTGIGFGNPLGSRE